VKDDHVNFYSSPGLAKFAGGLLVGAALANTSADEDINTWYQDSVRGSDGDRLSAVVKPLGNHWYTLPVYAGAGLLELFGDDSGPCAVAGEWGQRSLRAMLLAAPVVGVLQVTLGSSRPEEEGGSTWRPFDDNNGASGHAYVGAVPFLCAAGMTENRALKSAMYAGSVLCGLSRINDERHYASQVMLGWWVAYLAADAVDRTQERPGKVSFVPVAVEDGAAVAAVLTF